MAEMEVRFTDAQFANGDMPASWREPNGFTNEFEIFEFKNGGRWKFTLIAPNGSRMPIKVSLLT